MEIFHVFCSSLFGFTIVNFKYRAVLFIFNLKKSHKSPYLLRELIAARSSRTFNFNLTRFRSKHNMSISLLVSGIVLWNALPLPVKLGGSVAAFKAECGVFLN